MCTTLTLILVLSLALPAFATSTEKAVAADTAHKLLIDGNKRFVQEHYAGNERGKGRRGELTKGQHPFAVIVTCSDSRVPPELVFDQGLGDIFVVRVAGNVLDAIELGSVEYAVEHLNTKLVVVLGHEKCGAVKATVDGGDIPPNIKAIAAKIQPAVTAARATKTSNVYEAATDVNITNMVTAVKTDPVIAHIADVKVIGAKYHLESGEVVFTN
jgi:carbonic anhydrase